MKTMSSQTPRRRRFWLLTSFADCCSLPQSSFVMTTPSRRLSRALPSGCGAFPSNFFPAACALVCLLAPSFVSTVRAQAEAAVPSDTVVQEIGSVSADLPVPPVAPPTQSLRDAATSIIMPTPRTREVAYAPPAASPGTDPMVVIGRPAERANYGNEGNRKAAQLRSFPPESFTFDRSSLRDVLRFLAEQAGIPYIGIPERSAAAQRLVTFRMTASPFVALESVARQNDIGLTFEDGVWFMRIKDANLERAQAVENDNELIGVLYQLKHDPVDRVDFKENIGAGPQQANQNLGTGGSGVSGASQSLPLQYPQRVFDSKAPRIVNEIRVMLGMKPLEYNADGTVSDPDAASGTEVQRSVIPPFDGASTSSGTNQATGAGGSSLFPVYVPPQKPQVIYNSDTNVLWVVATRKQHKWVADYLNRVDKPQDLIAIEVKFFETRKNPQTDFGINWQGTFGGEGLVVRGQATANPSGLYTSTNNNASLNGVPNVLGATSLTTSTPFSAVLSTSEVSVALQAFIQDRDASLVQYPRVLTINNREVAITSAENTPVNAGTQNVTSGTVGGQNVGSLEYIPVGTQINILPKKVGQSQIALTVAITVSQIVDFIRLDLGTGENAYPVTTQRVYNATLQVDSGYTLAVGGLEKTSDRNNTGGIPGLKDIPGIGYFFKNKGRSRDKSNLIIFITPYLIADPAKTPGISEKPEAVIPLRPGLPPTPPDFSFDGTLVGGPSAVPGALAWLDFQLRFFRQINTENRTDHASIGKLREVISVARQLEAYLMALTATAGYGSESLEGEAATASTMLVDLNKTLAAAQNNVF